MACLLVDNEAHRHETGFEKRQHAEKPGQCRTPASYRLLYRTSDRGNWKEVPSPTTYGVEKDHFNTTTFDAVEAKAVRLEVKLRDNVSSGILEWRVE